MKNILFVLILQFFHFPWAAGLGLEGCGPLEEVGNEVRDPSVFFDKEKLKNLTKVFQNQAEVPLSAISEKSLLTQTVCLKRLFEEMVGLQKEIHSSIPETRMEISSLFTIVHDLLNNYTLKMEYVLKNKEAEKIVQDDFLYQAVTELGLGMDLDNLVFALKDLKDPLGKNQAERYFQLGRLISDPIDPVRPFSVLKDYAQKIHEMEGREKKLLMMRVIFFHMMKNGLKFTEKGRQSYLIFYKKEMAGKSGGEKRQFKEKIRLLNEDRERGLPLAFEKLGKILKVDAQDFSLALALTRDIFRKATYFQGKEIREGDIFVTPINHNAWSIFHLVANLPFFAIHAAIVGQDQDGPFDYYFLAEFLERGLEISDIKHDYQSKLIFRPLVGVEKGFVKEGLKNLADLGPNHFDILFDEGILNKKNEVRLYCSEFVYYLMKNRFLLEGPHYPTPFDAILAPVENPLPLVRENYGRLGLKPDFKVIQPEYLYYSPQADLLGSFYPMVTKSDIGRLEENLQVKMFIKELSEVAGEEFIKLLTTRKFRDMTPVERVLLESLWGAMDVSARVPLIRGKFPDLSVAADFEMPDGDSRYYYLRFGIFMLEWDRFFQGISPYDKDGKQDPHWKEKVLEKYRQNIVPKMKGLFVQ